VIQSLESTIAVCTHADGRGALAYGPVPGALRGHRTLTPGEGPVRCLRYTPGARVGACPMNARCRCSRVRYFVERECVTCSVTWLPLCPNFGCIIVFGRRVATTRRAIADAIRGFRRSHSFSFDHYAGGTRARSSVRLRVAVRVRPARASRPDLVARYGSVSG
jgi:hypothetical protein